MSADLCTCGHERGDHDDCRKHCLAGNDTGIDCHCQRFESYAAALSTLKEAVREWVAAKDGYNVIGLQRIAAMNDPARDAEFLRTRATQEEAEFRVERAEANLRTLAPSQEPDHG